MLEWKHYNVHWKLGERKGKTIIIALDKDDARKIFNNACNNEAADQRFYPFEAVATKVIGPLGQHLATPKQILAQQYRSCIGAAKMAEMALKRAIGKMKHTSVKANFDKIDKAHALAIAQSEKLLRDVRDLFRTAGLKVK